VAHALGVPRSQSCERMCLMKSTTNRPIDVVSSQLQAYAQRGVFRSFSQTATGEFRFTWLWNLPFRLSFDAKRGALDFKKLLPNIPAGSDLNTELKTFIKNCSSPDRPEHRRLDRQRVSVRYSNRSGTIGLTFLVLKNDYEYGVKKAINVVNEVFAGFLNVRYPEYMIENFHMPEE
jgi:hypothetical protein